MGFEFGPSDDEIWEKISSDNINSRVEGLLEAARKVAFVEENPLQAFNYLEPARVLADEVGDFTGLTHVYHNMGMIHFRLKQYEESVAAHEAGADAAKRGFRADMQIGHIANVARAYWKLGNDAAVRRNYELGIALATEINHWQQNALKAEYGRFLRKAGDLVGARVLLEAACASKNELNTGMASTELVTVLLEAGDYSSALTAAREVYSAAHYNEFNPLKGKAHYGVVRALIGLERFSEALTEVDALIEHGDSSIKHRVRIDLLRAAALIGLERETEALVILKLAIPLLSRYGLWRELGDALVSKASCVGEHLDAEEALVASVSAYEKAGKATLACDSRVRLAISSMAFGEWEKTEYWSELVIDDVLQMFSEGYPWALGLAALAKAKQGKLDAASVLAGQLFTHKDLSAMLRGHGYYAQALIAGGVKGKNLAVKAMKAYLEADVPSLATEVSALA